MRPSRSRIALPRWERRRRDDHRHHDAGARGQVGVESREPRREHNAARASGRRHAQAAVRRRAASVARGGDVAPGECHLRGLATPKPYDRHPAERRPEHRRPNTARHRRPSHPLRDQPRPAHQLASPAGAVREGDVAADVPSCDQRPRQPDPQLRSPADWRRADVRTAEAQPREHEQGGSESATRHVPVILRRHCRLCRRWPLRPPVAPNPAKSQTSRGKDPGTCERSLALLPPGPDAVRNGRSARARAV
jgi:hypothetical protein